MNGPSTKAFGCKYCTRRFKKQQALQDHLRDLHAITPVPVLKAGERRPSLAEIDPICIECGKLAVLVSGVDIYPHRPDLWGKHFYRCDCGAYCGTHPNSIVPLGFPCGPKTRQARQAAHHVFDPLWRNKEMTRAQAYAWLRDELKISADKCHIGMMTAAQALRVVEAVRKYHARKAAA